MNEIKRKFTGLWIPRHIVEDTRLTPLEKMLYAEIDSLDQEEGCFANNKYLADILCCSEDTVSRYVSHLIEIGYVVLVGFDGRQRRLNIVGRVGKNTEAASAPMQTIYNKDKINDNPNHPPSASVGEDADYETMMERRLAKGKKANRKPVEVKEPVEVIRPQEFKDFLAVFKWAGTDDKWIYDAWMKALQAGKKPSELVLAAKAHVRQVSSPQFMGSPQSWLSNGKWSLYAPKKVQVEAIKPLFPSVSDMVAKNCSNDEIELISTKYDIAKSWWNKQAKPTTKEMLEYLKKNA